MNRYTIAAMLLLASALALVYVYYPDSAPPGVTVDATPAREVAKEETVPLIVSFPLQAYKPAVKAKLKLPAAVVANPDAHVVASSKVKADDRPHTITTVLNSETGKFDTYDRTDPLPWLAPNTTTHISAYYGLKNSEQVIRLQVQQEFVRVKALRIEATASVDLGHGKPDPFIGIGGRFSF
jgi:hypothetical protein